MGNATFRMIPRSKGVSVVLLALLLLSGFLLLARRHEGRTMLFVVGLLTAALAAVFVWFLFSSRRTQFELSAQGLRIRRTLYGRHISASSLKAQEVRLLDLARDQDYRAVWRTNGLGLPDYQLGWFYLRNNTKALLFVTDRHKVVYLPTTEGFSLLMSVSEPDRFMDALHEGGIILPHPVPTRTDSRQIATQRP